MGEYEEKSLQRAFQNAIPHSITLSVNPTGITPLPHVISQLIEKFNSPLLLGETEKQIMECKPDPKKVLTEQIVTFFRRVDQLNARCKQSDILFQRRVWNRTKLLEFIKDKLLPNNEYRYEFYRLWMELAQSLDVELWEEKELR